MRFARNAFMMPVLMLLVLGASGWAIVAQEGVSVAQGQPSAQPTLPPAPGEAGSDDDASDFGFGAIEVETTAPETTETTEPVVPVEDDANDVDETPETIAPPVEDSAPTMPTVPTTGDACPTLIQEGYTATEIICEGLGEGEACIGNGVVIATPRANVTDIAFSQPGDVVPWASLSEIQLQTLSTADNVMSVVHLRPELPVADSNESASATFFLVGDVTLLDVSEEPTSSGVFPFATVQAGGGLNVRNAPNTSGDVVWQLTANERVIATGRTSDQQWIRIEIPSFYGGVGWVFGQFMSVDGGMDALPFVTEASPAPQISQSGVSLSTSQRFALLSAPHDVNCIETPPSGLVVQSPSGFSGMMQFEVNGVTMDLNGTLFLMAQADGLLVVDVLEGMARVNALGSSVSLQAGDSASVGMNVNLEPTGSLGARASTGDALVYLPVRLLPRVVFMGDGVPVMPAQTTETTGDDASGAVGMVCAIRTVDEVRNIRRGPGVDFEVVGVLEPNVTLDVFAQARDAFNYTWYETSRGFVRFDTVESQGDCQDLPQAAPVEPPEPSASEAETSAPVVTATNQLNSTLLGDVCTRTNVQTSLDVTEREFAYAMGGTWEAAPQTTVSFSVQGAVMRGEYGDYIRLTLEDGSTLAGSGDSPFMTVTFNEAVRFNTNVSATNGDFVILTVSCQ